VTASGIEQQVIEHQPLPPALRQLSIAPMPCLVAVPPTSSLPKIMTLVKEARARSVALLVPDRTKALQTLAAVTQLRYAAERAGVHLTLYAADQAIVQAAQQAGVTLVEVQGIIKPPRTGWKRRIMALNRLIATRPAAVRLAVHKAVTERIR